MKSQFELICQEKYGLNIAESLFLSLKLCYRCSRITQHCFVSYWHLWSHLASPCTAHLTCTFPQSHISVSSSSAWRTVHRRSNHKVLEMTTYLLLKTFRLAYKVHSDCWQAFPLTSSSLSKEANLRWIGSGLFLLICFWFGLFRLVCISVRELSLITITIMIIITITIVINNDATLKVFH